MSSSPRKSILITGCSSGIGFVAAKMLQERGYLVVASCRKAEDIQRLKTEGLAHVLHLDLDDSQSIDQAVKGTLEITGGDLFALFNNGAYGQPGAVEDLSRETLRKQFETNVFGTHELTRLLLPTFLAQPDARIVQNSSILGFVASPTRGAYIASKYALEGLTDTMRLELHGTSVKAILIEPGPIVSRFRQNALAALKTNIDMKNSRHTAMYDAALARLSKSGPSMRGTLPESAVVKKLIHALESRRPKARYSVTMHTHTAAFFKRIMSVKQLDWMLRVFGGN